MKIVNLNDHNQKASDAQKQVNDAKTTVTNDKQTLNVPSDLATKLSNYLSTGKYSNSQEDKEALKKNQFVESDKDNVEFDPFAPMSDADRNYYNLYALDLINQARAQVGLKPVVASELAKNFAKQVSDNYTAEKYGFKHDLGMLSRTSVQMHAGWTGENISWSGAYALFNSYPDAFPNGYTVNNFKRDIYEAISSMLLDDADSDYSHAINFLNPDVYSFGFSYRIGNRDGGDIDGDASVILNFEAIISIAKR
jgi:SEC10/PgrA surface exclusion-like protein